MRLVDADALKRIFDEKCAMECACCEEAVVNQSRNAIGCGLVNRAPTVDAAPVVHAKWVVDGPGLTCSACQEWVDSEVYYMLSPRQNPTYCPYCGAKMDGEAT